MQSNEMEGLELPLKVQTQWERAAGPLSPMDRLNAAFETIPVSFFPLLALGSGASRFSARFCLAFSFDRAFLHFCVSMSRGFVSVTGVHI